MTILCLKEKVNWKKKNCCMAPQDFSRFSWTFFKKALVDELLGCERNITVKVENYKYVSSKWSGYESEKTKIISTQLDFFKRLFESTQVFLQLNLISRYRYFTFISCCIFPNKKEKKYRYRFKSSVPGFKRVSSNAAFLKKNVEFWEIQEWRNTPNQIRSHTRYLNTKVDVNFLKFANLHVPNI